MSGVPRGRSARWLPWEPLKAALLRLAERDGYTDTLGKWRDLYDFDRLWSRCEKSGQITEAQADGLCCDVLRVTPHFIYGELWEAIPPIEKRIVDGAHGKLWNYNRGCRCDLCSEAMRIYKREYQRTHRKRKEQAA